MNRSRTSHTGFTLIELLVVISIVGILTMIALPNLKSLMESQRVTNASYEMFTVLSLARSEAIKRNGNIKITPVFTAGVLTSIDIVKVDDGTVIDSKPAPKGVSVAASTSAAAGLTYNRNGRTAETNVTFEIDVAGAATPTKYVRCITVELSGMPRTRRQACP